MPRNILLKNIYSLHLKDTDEDAYRQPAEIFFWEIFFHFLQIYILLRNNVRFGIRQKTQMRIDVPLKAEKRTGREKGWDRWKEEGPTLCFFNIFFQFHQLKDWWGEITAYSSLSSIFEWGNCEIVLQLVLFIWPRRHLGGQTAYFSTTSSIFLVFSPIAREWGKWSGWKIKAIAGFPPS